MIPQKTIDYLNSYKDYLYQIDFDIKYTTEFNRSYKRRMFSGEFYFNVYVKEVIEEIGKWYEGLFNPDINLVFSQNKHDLLNFKGCFPKSFGPTTYSMDFDSIQMRASFSFDYMTEPLILARQKIEFIKEWEMLIQ